MHETLLLFALALILIALFLIMLQVIFISLFVIFVLIVSLLVMFLAGALADIVFGLRASSDPADSRSKPKRGCHA